MKPKSLLTRSQINERVRTIAKQISNDYVSHDLLLIGILKGSVVFLSDLMRYITIPHKIDFMDISSYDGQQSGIVRINMDLDSPIAKKHVLIVEDIVDTGETLAYLLDALQTRHPLSLRVCTLLDKTEARKIDVPIAYSGFTIANHFVVGYGMDINEEWRHLDYVGITGF